MYTVLAEQRELTGFVEKQKQNKATASVIYNLPLTKILHLFSVMEIKAYAALC